MEIENGRMIFGYMAMKLAGPWNSQTIFHHNRCVSDDYGNWWVSKKSSAEAPNLNHPVPGFDEHGDPIASEWWALWIDWQHPMAQILSAIQTAAAAAADAETQARAAEQAAEEAGNIDVSGHETRITALESALSTLEQGDIAQMQQAIAALEALIGEDVDGNINKFNEIVEFLENIEEGSSLETLLSQIASQIAAKQDAGDYATNTRVDALEAAIGKYSVPRYEGDALVFPAENGAYFEDDELILTQ